MLSLTSISTFVTNRTLIVQVGFSWVTSDLLALNSSVRVLCIIPECVPEHVAYLEHLGRMYKDRFEVIVCSPYDMPNVIPTNIHKACDGLFLAHNNMVHQLFLSATRLLANTANVLFENFSDSAYLRESHLLLQVNQNFYTFRRPTIEIRTLAYGEEYKEKVKVCMESKERYATKHGYVIRDIEDIVDNTRPISWSKIKSIQSALENTLMDFVVWLDADTMITNDMYTLDDIFTLFPKNKDLLIGQDMHSINCGVFIIRNTSRMKQLLNDIWAQEECINDPWWEQAAMIRLLVTYYNDVAHVIPHQHIRIINGYLSTVDKTFPHRPQDFIVHFASLKDEKLQKAQEECERSTHPNYYEMWKNIIECAMTPPFQVPIMSQLKPTIQPYEM